MTDHDARGLPTSVSDGTGQSMAYQRVTSRLTISMAMTTIHADELRPGDVITYDGLSHLITEVERDDGWAWPIAADGSGWAIGSVINSSTYDAERLDPAQTGRHSVHMNGPPSAPAKAARADASVGPR